MNQETFEGYKKDELYKKSAVPFINTLLSLNVPLSAITTNDWHSNYMPRVYVTREYGREYGGLTMKAHVMQLGSKSAKRLSNFYHS